MKTSALTFLLLFISAFAFATKEKPADVLGLRWGMTAEEVSAVRPLSQDTPGSDVYGAGTIKIAGKDFDVIVTIKSTTGLEEVSISAIGGATTETFMDILGVLEARYKRPNKVDVNSRYIESRTAIWELPRTKIQLLFMSGGLFFTYTARPGYDVIDQL